MLDHHGQKHAVEVVPVGASQLFHGAKVHHAAAHCAGPVVHVAVAGGRGQRLIMPWANATSALLYGFDEPPPQATSTATTTSKTKKPATHPSLLDAAPTGACSYIL